MFCPRRSEIGGRTITLDHWRGDGTCSFCGSVSPDEFMRAIEHGALICPTTKSYKAYLLSSTGDTHKFYFQHLSDAQRVRMVELLVMDRLNISEPGFFDPLPFFMRCAEVQEKP